MRLLLTLIFLLSGWALLAQVTDTTKQVAEEDDYSAYEAVSPGTLTASQRFCTPKVLDQSPLKLVSIGYEVQSDYSLQIPGLAGFLLGSGTSLGPSHGARFNATIPVISKPQMLLMVGLNYQDQRYTIGKPTGLLGIAFDTVRAVVGSDSLNRFLQQQVGSVGIRSMGMNGTLFKPLDKKNFILMQTQLDVNGNFGIPTAESLNYLRFSFSSIWGRKVHDRLMWGVGISRNFRAGELGYFPVVLFNYTAPSRKWGIESLLPGRAHFRYTLNPRNILFAGLELEGTSYTLLTNNDILPRLELRRSELRFRLIYERCLSGFLWASFQAGYRYNFSFRFDAPPGNDDFFRGFTSTRPYFIDSRITNSFYAQITFQLVSP